MEVIATVARHSYMPWKPMLVMPVGDVQYDGPDGAADIDRLVRHLKWGVEHDAYFIGMGDYVDFMSPSNRSRLRSAGLYDTASSVIDRAATALEDDLKATLEFTRGRWIGLLQGHHYFTHLDGTTSDTRLANFLNAPYLGDCTIIRITFREEQGGASNIKLWAHHGHGGGGVLPTAGLNRLYHQASRYPGIRIFMMGHVPQLGHSVMDGLDITDRGEPVIVHESRHLIMTGGFAKGYLQGSQFAGRAQGGYAEKAMMPPAVLGGALITLTPERYQRRGSTHRTVDVKVSS